MNARERITQVVEGWFLTEPLLFAGWTMHDVVETFAVATIRVGHGRVEFNPEFVCSLKRDDLRSVLSFEAMRILLGHPYTRRQSNAELSYQASNLTVQECLRTKLPIPRARDLFEDDSFDDQYFEFYYRELSERSQEEPDPSPPDETASESSESGESSFDDDLAGEHKSDESNENVDSLATEEAADDMSDDTADDGPGKSIPATASSLDAYGDPQQVGMENASEWEDDDLLRDEISAAVREAAETEGWGTLGGRAKEQLLATLKPKLDYRGVLRQFRQSVLSVQRRLTRMKPSRRYGLAQMGSRYDFTTRLLFAIDVSGSMGTRDLQLGFSVISRFFRYGVEALDVIWFDTEIRSQPLTLRRARQSFEVTGRGGTNFDPVLDYIDEHRDYDGLIIFTDGYAPVPPAPQNRRTQVLWLFKDESTYQNMAASLRGIGKAAFLQPSGRGSRQALTQQ